MKRLLLILFCVIFILSSCSQDNGGEIPKLIITNDTDTELSLITIEYVNQSQNGSSADGSPIKKGDSLTFTFPDLSEDNLNSAFLFTITAYDSENNAVANIMTANPFIDESGKVNYHITEDTEGLKIEKKQS